MNVSHVLLGPSTCPYSLGISTGLYPPRDIPVVRVLRSLLQWDLQFNAGSERHSWGGFIPVSYTHLDVYKRQVCSTEFK